MIPYADLCAALRTEETNLFEGLEFRNGSFPLVLKVAHKSLAKVTTYNFIGYPGAFQLYG